jgi:para-aminobenzoate synthetase/4-amino-4-deoxychorismate lyase
MWRGSFRVVRHRLAWELRPQEAALLVREDDRPFALIGDWAGGGALIGSDPVRVAGPGEDPFALLDDQPQIVGAADGAVGGGWFGYLGYELCHRVEAVGQGPPPRARLPAAELAFYDHVLRADADGVWWFEALWSDARAPALRRRLADLSGRVPGRARPFATAPWTALPGAAGHAAAVAAARERISAGDIFQANVCRRLQSRLTGDPLDLFVAASARLGAGRAAFVGGAWGAVASLSPELFLERWGRRVRSAPIKGTAGLRSGAALGSSGKDRAENVMIVDLVRNDLGRVCVPGSIAVPALARQEAHTGVLHLVSEVTGILRPEVGDAELLAATFPPGSVTGAPKVAAMDVIAELESAPREVYTGAIGFASPLAGLELSVAIRTFEVRGDEIWMGVGGGIVADSDPAAELAECDAKAGPLLAAIGARRAGDEPVGGQSPPPRRLGARPVRRPDPRAGVFETLRVADDGPVALARHLARLEASVGELYGQPLPAGLAEELSELRGQRRLRVSLRPRRRGPLEAVVELMPLPAARPPVALARVAVAGGIGAHKWCDRRLLDALAAAVAPAQPLICDLDGHLLEAARANLFVVDAGGVLVTPPVAGRLLPGVTRARVLELGLEVRIGELGEHDLRAAREVFVTGSIGGVEAVTSCDGCELAGERAVGEMLGLALAGAAPVVPNASTVRRREGPLA